MRVQSVFVAGVSILVALAAIAGAFYYRDRAIRFERQYRVAAERLARSADTTVAVEPASRPRPGTGGTSAAQAPSDVDLLSLPVPPPSSQGGQGAGGTPATVPASPPPTDPDRSRRRSSDWMANLRTNDPQRYAEIQQRRQAFQQEMQNAWGNMTNYFMSRDTSRMSGPERDEYNALLTLLNQTWALNQQLQSGLPADARQQVFSALRSNVTAVIPLLDRERNREYYDAALSMGQSEEDAATMVYYINQITSNTSIRAVLPGLRMGGMFGGGMPPSGNAPSSAPARP